MPQNKISTRFYNDCHVRAAWDTERERWFFSVLDVVGAINEEDEMYFLQWLVTQDYISTP